MVETDIDDRRVAFVNNLGRIYFTQAMLADIMGKAQHTISYHINKLLEDGEISIEENTINSKNIENFDILTDGRKGVILYDAKVFTLLAFKVNSPTASFIKDAIVKLVNDTLVGKICMMVIEHYL